MVAGTYFVFAQETRNVGDFNSLKVYDRIPVELVKSSKSKVEITKGNNTDVEVVNKNGELKTIWCQVAPFVRKAACVTRQ